MDEEKERKNVKFCQFTLMGIGVVMIGICGYDYFKTKTNLVFDALFALVGIGFILLGYLAYSSFPFIDKKEEEEEPSEEKLD